MNRATGREKGEEERKEKKQSNSRARAGNISGDSSCSLLKIVNTLKEKWMAGE